MQEKLLDEYEQGVLNSVLAMTCSQLKAVCRSLWLLPPKEQGAVLARVLIEVAHRDRIVDESGPPRLYDLAGLTKKLYLEFLDHRAVSDEEWLRKRRILMPRLEDSFEL